MLLFIQYFLHHSISNNSSKTMDSSSIWSFSYTYCMLYLKRFYLWHLEFLNKLFLSCSNTLSLKVCYFNSETSIILIFHLNLLCFQVAMEQRISYSWFLTEVSAFKNHFTLIHFGKNRANKNEVIFKSNFCFRKTISIRGKDR